MPEKHVSAMTVNELRAEIQALAGRMDGDSQARAYDVREQLGAREPGVFRTADGVVIADGLAVWDYNLRAGRVNFSLSRVDSQYFDGWFTVVQPDGGQSLMNGERMTTRHPMTRRSAGDALTA